MRKPEVRERILNDKPASDGHPLMFAVQAFDWIFPLGDPPDYEPDPADSIAARAKARGVSPLEEAYDRLLDDDGHAMLLVTLANFRDASLDTVAELVRREDVVLGLGDGGAHYGMICDASFPTYMLTHWVRDRASGRLTVAEAVRELTSAPARVAGLADRGRIAVGYKADLNVIDHDAMRLHRPIVALRPACGRSSARPDRRRLRRDHRVRRGDRRERRANRRPARAGWCAAAARARIGVTRVAPLAPPWSAADAADINSWGHPDRTYEPLLLVRCLQRHPVAGIASAQAGRGVVRRGTAAARGPGRSPSCASARWCAANTSGAARPRSGDRSQASATRSATHWSPASADDPRWSAGERVLIGAVDELETTGSWSEKTWNALGEDLDDEQRMELLIAVGWYRTIATLCNGLALPVEGWMRRWPASAD